MPNETRTQVTLCETCAAAQIHDAAYYGVTDRVRQQLNIDLEGCTDKEKEDELVQRLSRYGYLETYEPIAITKHVGYWECWVCKADEIGTAQTYNALLGD